MTSELNSSGRRTATASATLPPELHPTTHGGLLRHLFQNRDQIIRVQFVITDGTMGRLSIPPAVVSDDSVRSGKFRYDPAPGISVDRRAMYQNKRRSFPHQVVAQMDTRKIEQHHFCLREIVNSECEDTRTNRPKPINPTKCRSDKFMAGSAGCLPTAPMSPVRPPSVDRHVP